MLLKLSCVASAEAVKPFVIKFYLEKAEVSRKIVQKCKL